MDRYSRKSLEDLVVPNYHETSDSYPSPDMWGTGWSMNSSEAVEKCFDYDVINNGFSGGLYSQMEMGTREEAEQESKRLKASGCFDRALHDFDGIQQMDDIFLYSSTHSLRENCLYNTYEEDSDVPGNANLDSFKESDYNNIPSSSSAFLDNIDGREVPMFYYNWETCQDMPLTEEEAPMSMCEENMEEASAEEVVLQDLQRATEKLTDETRKCFRDTFYRLAKNSLQKSDSGNTSNSEEDGTRKHKSELETNSIDRAVANLTFNKMESNMRNLPPPKRLSSIQG